MREGNRRRTDGWMRRKRVDDEGKRSWRQGRSLCIDLDMSLLQQVWLNIPTEHESSRLDTFTPRAVDTHTEHIHLRTHTVTYPHTHPHTHRHSPTHTNPPYPPYISLSSYSSCNSKQLKNNCSVLYFRLSSCLVTQGLKFFQKQLSPKSKCVYIYRVNTSISTYIFVYMYIFCCKAYSHIYHEWSVNCI